MNMFSNLATKDMEEARDVIGGSFEPLPSGIYDATVKLMYAGSSTSGAQNVTVILNVDGKEVRETIYVTTKEGHPFYVDKATKKHMPLPGFSLVNDLCLLTTEKELTSADIEVQPKTVNVWSFEAKAEVPTEVPVFLETLTKPVKVVISREIVDKEKKGDDGKYHPTGETRMQNAIQKFLHPETSRTVNEYMKEIAEPVFATEWSNRFAGKDRNKSTGSSSAGASGTGRPGAAAKPAATKSLFGN